jgi:hypothetical protein
MRVYHFLPANWAIDDIEKRRVKISEIEELNDPFELWCVSQQDRRLREALRGFKKEMEKSYGMICFSRRWHSPLLWSHYAAKHSGICLGFEVDDRGLKAVSYVAERPNLRIPPTVKSMEQLLFTKFKDWQYEEEWRNWFRLDERDGDHYFYPFDGFVQLREVITGPICQTPKVKIDEALSSYSDRVHVLKARLAFKTFRVVRNREAFRR